MMATPNERWRLIIAASFLLHLMLICGIDLELGSPIIIPKPQPKTIALILQKAPMQVSTSTPPPDLTVQAEPVPNLQTVEPTPSITTKPTLRQIKPLNTPVPNTHRYIKAPIVQPTIAKAKPTIPKPTNIRPQTIKPKMPSIGIPVQASKPITPVQSSPIPDDLTNIPSIGMPVIAAQVPKPKANPTTPQIATPKVETMAKPVIKPTPLAKVQSHHIEVQDIETVETQQTELDTEELSELEPAPLEDIAERTVETETVAAQRTELKPLAALPKQPSIDTPSKKIQPPPIQAESINVPPKPLPNLTNAPLEKVQPHQVHIAVVRPIFLTILESFLNVLKPLTEIVQTASQTPSTIDQPTNTADKIPEQYMNNNWQRATKQAVQDNTAKTLAQSERDQKLGKLVFREQKDYGDLPEPINDNNPKNNAQKRKDSKLGIKLGDSCFLGFQSEKEDSKFGKKRNTMIPIDCNF